MATSRLWGSLQRAKRFSSPPRAGALSRPPGRKSLGLLHAFLGMDSCNGRRRFEAYWPLQVRSQHVGWQSLPPAFSVADPLRSRCRRWGWSDEDQHQNPEQPGTAWQHQRDQSGITRQPLPAAVWRRALPWGSDQWTGTGGSRSRGDESRRLNGWIGSSRAVRLRKLAVAGRFESLRNPIKKAPCGAQKGSKKRSRLRRER